ncbi:MAG: hypothetical protein ACK5HL_04725 [Bacilli bacterium]
MQELKYPSVDDIKKIISSCPDEITIIFKNKNLDNTNDFTIISILISANYNLLNLTLNNSKSQKVFGLLTTPIIGLFVLFISKHLTMIIYQI